MIRSVVVRAALAATFIAAMAQGAAAGEARDQKEDLARAAHKLYSGAQGVKGTHRLMMEREKRQVESLIEDLEAGRPVDPAAVERALNRAERPNW